jgi:predicted amidohydrolase YtcJ
MFSPAWPSTDMASIREMLADWGKWLAGRGLGDHDLRMCGLFTESDYSQDNRLRARCGPYTGWAGFNYDCALPEDTMIEMMAEAARNGIRVGMIGPRALDRFDRVNRTVPIAGQRWVLEHAGYFAPDDVARTRDLGCVVQSYSEKWIERDGDEILAKQGQDGGERALPMRALIEAGIHVALATDNVPPTLFEAIAHVVRRRTSGGRTIGPGQALTRLEALAAASREGAYLSFDETEKGTIEAGKLADLAILSDDLLTADEDRIRHISSVMTITGGRIVHDDGTLTST